MPELFNRAVLDFFTMVRNYVAATPPSGSRGDAARVGRTIPLANRGVGLRRR
jgi:hypothetical protein